MRFIPLKMLKGGEVLAVNIINANMQVLMRDGAVLTLKIIERISKYGIKSIYIISNLELCLKNISSTFHGRDIFAPIAAHISNGISVDMFGEKTTSFFEFDLFDVVETDDGIIGRVVNIDNFGNIISNISQEIIDKNFKTGKMSVL